jgi:hypothetical protein
MRYDTMRISEMFERAWGDDPVRNFVGVLLRAGCFMSVEARIRVWRLRLGLFLGIEEGDECLTADCVCDEVG